MNHPNSEEWIPWLFDEADAETKARLGAHLQSCPECRRELDGWRRSVARLDAWKLPARRQRRRHLPPMPPIAWAAAALLIITVFIAGHLSGAARREEPSSQRLQAAFAAELSQLLAQNRLETSNAMASLETRLLGAALRSHKDMVADLAQAIAAMRVDDRRAMDALVQRIEERHALDYVTLRRDLENLATATDAELQRARARLTEVAAAAAMEENDTQH